MTMTVLLRHKLRVVSQHFRVYNNQMFFYLSRCAVDVMLFLQSHDYKETDFNKSNECYENQNQIHSYTEAYHTSLFSLDTY